MPAQIVAKAIIFPIIFVKHAQVGVSFAQTRLNARFVLWNIGSLMEPVRSYARRAVSFALVLPLVLLAKMDILQPQDIAIPARANARHVIINIAVVVALKGRIFQTEIV